MTLLVFAVACLLFGAALVRLRVVEHAAREFRQLAREFAALREPGIPDAEKESRVRAAAVEGCRGALGLFARTSATAGAALSPVLLADLASLAPMVETMHFAMRPDVLAATTAVAVALLVADRYGFRRRAPR